VSKLASCQKLPATVPDLTNRPRQLVFLTPIDSRLNDFLNEIHQIARLEPSIVERIDEDLDLHAKKKKLLRLIDAQFLAGQTPDLPKLQLRLRELKLDNIDLEISRPRTEAYIVYLFLMRLQLNRMRRHPLEQVASDLSDRFNSRKLPPVIRTIAATASGSNGCRGEIHA